MITQPLPNLPFGGEKKLENQDKILKSSMFLTPVLKITESLGTEWDRRDLSSTEHLSARLRKHLGRKSSGSSIFGVCWCLLLEISSMVLLMSDVFFLQS